MLIRNEIPGDRVAVHALNAAAFETAAEAGLVDALREQARPLVSLVADDGGAVIGHILFSPVALSGHPGLALMGLAPMAVAAAHRNRGVGSALVREGLERCREIGCDAVVVLGHPAYYPRFGFVPAAGFGIGCEYDAPAEAFMLLELRPGALAGAGGTVRYHAAFATL